MRTKFLLVASGLMLTVIFMAIVSTSHFSQTKKSTSSDSREHIAKVVTQYWQLSQEGKFASASKLTTNTRKGFTFSIDDPISSWEEIIHSTELKFIQIEKIREVDPGEVEVACKVKHRFGQYIYLFHTVVKDESGWKIFSTSY